MAVFVDVARQESFSAAGRKLRLTPSAVSKLITRMEERLGSRLFNRTTRKLSLTEGGRQYYERCVQILSEIEEAEEVLAGFQGEARGVLRVTCSPAFAKYELTPCISEFLRLHPQLRLELRISGETLDLLSHDIDVAIRHGNLADSSLVARKLNETHFTVCASPAYLEENGTPMVPEDLAHHNCLYAPTANTLNLWRFSRNGRQQAVTVSGNFSCDTVEAMRDLALQGGGVVNLAEFVVATDLREGRLVKLLPGYSTPALPVHLVYAHRKHTPNKVREFVDFLLAHCAVQSAGGGAGL